MTFAQRDLKDVANLVARKLEDYMNNERRETRFQPAGCFRTTKKMQSYDLLTRVMETSDLDYLPPSNMKRKKSPGRRSPRNKSPDGKVKKVPKSRKKDSSKERETTKKHKVDKSQRKDETKSDTDKRGEVENRTEKEGKNEKEEKESKVVQKETWMRLIDAKPDTSSSTIKLKIEPKLEKTSRTIVARKEAARLSEYASHVFDEQPLDKLHVIHRYRPNSMDIPHVTENGKVQNYSCHFGSALHAKKYIDYYMKEGLQTGKREYSKRLQHLKTKDTSSEKGSEKSSVQTTGSASTMKTRGYQDSYSEKSRGKLPPIHSSSTDLVSPRSSHSVRSSDSAMSGYSRYTSSSFNSGLPFTYKIVSTSQGPPSIQPYSPSTSIQPCPPTRRSYPEPYPPPVQSEELESGIAFRMPDARRIPSVRQAFAEKETYTPRSVMLDRASSTTDLLPKLDICTQTPREDEIESFVIDSATSASDTFVNQETQTPRSSRYSSKKKKKKKKHHSDDRKDEISDLKDEFSHLSEDRKARKHRKHTGDGSVSDISRTESENLTSFTGTSMSQTSYLEESESTAPNAKMCQTSFSLPSEDWYPNPPSEMSYLYLQQRRNADNESLSLQSVEADNEISSLPNSTVHLFKISSQDQDPSDSLLDSEGQNAGSASLGAFEENRADVDSSEDYYSYERADDKNIDEQKEGNDNALIPKLLDKVNESDEGPPKENSPCQSDDDGFLEDRGENGLSSERKEQVQTVDIASLGNDMGTSDELPSVINNTQSTNDSTVQTVDIASLGNDMGKSDELPSVINNTQTVNDSTEQNSTVTSPSDCPKNEEAAKMDVPMKSEETNDTSTNGVLNDTSTNGVLNDTSTNGVLNDTSTNGVLNDTSTNGVLSESFEESSRGAVEVSAVDEDPRGNTTFFDMDETKEQYHGNFNTQSENSTFYRRLNSDYKYVAEDRGSDGESYGDSEPEAEVYTKTDSHLQMEANDDKSAVNVDICRGAIPPKRKESNASSYYSTVRAEGDMFPAYQTEQFDRPSSRCSQVSSLRGSGKSSGQTDQTLNVPTVINETSEQAPVLNETQDLLNEDEMKALMKENDDIERLPSSEGNDEIEKCQVPKRSLSSCSRGSGDNVFVTQDTILRGQDPQKNEDTMDEEMVENEGDNTDDKLNSSLGSRGIGADVEESPAGIGEEIIQENEHEKHDDDEEEVDENCVGSGSNEHGSDTSRSTSRGSGGKLHSDSVISSRGLDEDLDLENLKVKEEREESSDYGSMVLRTENPSARQGTDLMFHQDGNVPLSAIEEPSLDLTVDQDFSVVEAVCDQSTLASLRGFAGGEDSPRADSAAYVRGQYDKDDKQSEVNPFATDTETKDDQPHKEEAYSTRENAATLDDKVSYEQISIGELAENLCDQGERGKTEIELPQSGNDMDIHEMLHGLDKEEKQDNTLNVQMHITSDHSLQRPSSACNHLNAELAPSVRQRPSSANPLTASGGAVTPLKVPNEEFEVNEVNLENDATEIHVDPLPTADSGLLDESRGKIEIPIGCMPVNKDMNKDTENCILEEPEDSQDEDLDDVFIDESETKSKDLLNHDISNDNEVDLETAEVTHCNYTEHSEKVTTEPTNKLVTVIGQDVEDENIAAETTEEMCKDAQGTLEGHADIKQDLETLKDDLECPSPLNTERGETTYTPRMTSVPIVKKLERSASVCSRGSVSEDNDTVPNEIVSNECLADVQPEGKQSSNDIEHRDTHMPEEHVEKFDEGVSHSLQFAETKLLEEESDTTKFNTSVDEKEEDIPCQSGEVEDDDKTLSRYLHTATHRGSIQHRDAVLGKDAVVDILPSNESVISEKESLETPRKELDLSDISENKQVTTIEDSESVLVASLPEKDSSIDMNCMKDDITQREMITQNNVEHTVNASEKGTVNFFRAKENDDETENVAYKTNINADETENNADQNAEHTKLVGAQDGLNFFTVNEDADQTNESSNLLQSLTVSNETETNADRTSQTEGANYFTTNGYATVTPNSSCLLQSSTMTDSFFMQSVTDEMNDSTNSASTTTSETETNTTLESLQYVRTEDLSSRPNQDKSDIFVGEPDKINLHASELSEEATFVSYVQEVVIPENVKDLNFSKPDVDILQENKSHEDDKETSAAQSNEAGTVGPTSACGPQQDASNFVRDRRCSLESRGSQDGQPTGEESSQLSPRGDVTVSTVNQSVLLTEDIPQSSVYINGSPLTVSENAVLEDEKLVYRNLSSPPSERIDRTEVSHSKPEGKDDCVDQEQMADKLSVDNLHSAGNVNTDNEESAALVISVGEPTVKNDAQNTTSNEYHLVLNGNSSPKSPVEDPKDSQDKTTPRNDNRDTSSEPVTFSDSIGDEKVPSVSQEKAPGDGSTEETERSQMITESVTAEQEPIPRKENIEGSKAMNSSPLNSPGKYVPKVILVAEKNEDVKVNNVLKAKASTKSEGLLRSGRPASVSEEESHSGPVSSEESQHRRGGQGENQQSSVVQNQEVVSNNKTVTPRDTKVAEKGSMIAAENMAESEAAGDEDSKRDDTMISKTAAAQKRVHDQESDGITVMSNPGRLVSTSVVPSDPGQQSSSQTASHRIILVSENIPSPIPKARVIEQSPGGPRVILVSEKSHV